MSRTAPHSLTLVTTFSPVSGSFASTMMPHGDGACGVGTISTRLYRMSPSRAEIGVPLGVQAGESLAMVGLWQRTKMSGTSLLPAAMSAARSDSPVLGFDPKKGTPLHGPSFGFAAHAAAATRLYSTFFPTWAARLTARFHCPSAKAVAANSVGSESGP